MPIRFTRPLFPCSPDTAHVVSRKKRRGIIEKRRRDRINNSLVELRRLVPAAFEKQGSAKLEKAEILQMTVDHLRHLHQTRDARGGHKPQLKTECYLYSKKKQELQTLTWTHFAFPKKTTAFLVSRRCRRMIVCGRLKIE
jgi:hypothetical protein